MNDFEKTINAIKEDLKCAQEIPRNEFLARCAQKRIISLSKKQNQDFDKMLNDLESSLTLSDFNSISRILIPFTKLMNQMCNSTFIEISNYQKFFQKHK
jgi:hypothetical protein